MKRKLIIVGASLGIFLLSIGLAVFFAKQKKEPEFTPPSVLKKQVLTTPVAYSSIKTNVVAYGRVETAQLLSLLSEVSGRMFEGRVRLKAGERFKSGELLFYIDDTEASLSLKAQKSNFLRDLAAILPDLNIDFNANYANWQRYFNRLDIEKKFPLIPDPGDDKEKTFLATKGIYSSYYAIKSAEARLSKYRYYAPFTGSIMEMNLQSGSFVTPGVQIGKIIRTGHHELKVSIDTKDIVWINLGSEAEIYDDQTGNSWEGRVIRIGNFVNPNTQSIDVFIKIMPKGKKIYDGQFFRVSIPSHTIRQGMMIPRNTIYNGNEVFVVHDSLLRIKNINVHRLLGEEAVFSGLDEGTDLVVEPLVGGHNNMVVEKKGKRRTKADTVSAQ